MTKPINDKNSIWDLVFRKKTPTNNSIPEDLHPKADSIRGNLEKIFKDLGQKKELISHAEEVIHPLLREVEHLQSRLKSKSCPKTLSKYTQWTEKAASWVKLYSNMGKEEALLHNIVEKSHSLVDRDISLIEKYMEALNLDPVSKAKLDPEIQSLASMQKPPSNLSLRKITSWKSDFNANRAEIVNAALQKIDDLKTI